MTNPTTPTAEDPHALPEVTLDRIIEAMKTFDIELEPVTGRDDAATANLNGLPCMFAVLESVAIVRCDVPTDVNYAKADAGLFLAANQINSVAMGHAPSLLTSMACCSYAPRLTFLARPE